MEKSDLSIDKQWINIVVVIILKISSFKNGIADSHLCSSMYLITCPSLYPLVPLYTMSCHFVYPLSLRYYTLIKDLSSSFFSSFSSCYCSPFSRDSLDSICDMWVCPSKLHSIYRKCNQREIYNYAHIWIWILLDLIIRWFKHGTFFF